MKVSPREAGISIASRAIALAEIITGPSLSIAGGEILATGINNVSQMGFSVPENWPVFSQIYETVSSFNGAASLGSVIVGGLFLATGLTVFASGVTNIFKSDRV